MYYGYPATNQINYPNMMNSLANQMGMNMQNNIPVNNSLMLTRVTGLEGAKAYQMPANSTVALFDNNEDLMYIKTTDGAGFPTIRTFSFSEVVANNNPVPDNVDYVTRDEFNKLKEELLNGKQSISRSKSNLNSADKSADN
nr:MAG TPA: hypothetical protein [Caudoviricetes sp.]